MSTNTGDPWPYQHHCCGCHHAPAYQPTYQPMVPNFAMASPLSLTDAPKVERGPFVSRIRVRPKRSR